MSVLHERPAHLARSRVCHALGLSRTGTYPRQRAPRVSDAVSPCQPRGLTDEQRGQVLELVNSEAHQDASVRVIYARELSAGPERVIRTLDRIIEWGGQPPSIRCDNGPENISGALPNWAELHGIAITHIQPGKPQRKDYIESYNRTVRFDWLGQFGCTSIAEVRDFATEWLWTYNNERANMALGGITPKMKTAMAAGDPLLASPKKAETTLPALGIAQFRVGQQSFEPGVPLFGVAQTPCLGDRHAAER